MTVPQRPAKAAAGASPNDSTKESGDSGHWLTASSNKRHNSGCKYYKSSKGRPCGPNDGTPCKICGG
jgi:hypothetical protein